MQEFEKKVQQTNQSKPPEHHQEREDGQPLPSVWDLLERRVNIHEEFSSNRITEQEYDRTQTKLNRLEDEIDEKGILHDKLILELYTTKSMEPGQFPVPVYFRELTLEEFQKFRSKIESLSEEEIREEIGKAEKEYEKKREADPLAPPPPPGSPIRV